MSLQVTELLGVRVDFFGTCMSLCVAFVPSTGDGVFVMCPKNWNRVLSGFVVFSFEQSVVVVVVYGFTMSSPFLSLLPMLPYRDVNDDLYDGVGAVMSSTDLLRDFILLAM